MITELDREEMKPQGNKVISLKLSSSENIICEMVELLEDDGILVVKNPLKIMQGVDQSGNEMLMMNRFDPAASDEVFAFAATHVITLQPVAYRFKQKYIQNILRYKLYDLEFNDENSIYDYLTSYLMKICDDLGVEANLDMIPISLKNVTRH